jgi:ribosomal protein S18 acetylase RimI-like enzyme
MTPRPTHQVRLATGDEWRPLGHLLAGAFDDDPVWQWVAPDPARRARHLGRAFGQLIRRRTRAGTVWTTDDLAGAAMWAEPGDWRETPGEMARMALPMAASIGLRRVRGRAAALSAMERHHPTEPHWYLAILGADPARRGQGIGGALMEPMMQRCDEQGMPAYLESSKEANLAFYHRHGFEVTGQVHLAPDCPPVWSMWRDPR